MSYLTCLQQNPCSVLSLVPGSLVLNSFSLMRGDCFVGTGVQLPFLSDGWFHLFSFKNCLLFLFLSLKYVFMISVKNFCGVVISNSWGQRFCNIVFSVLIFEDTWFKWWIYKENPITHGTFPRGVAHRETGRLGKQDIGAIYLLKTLGKKRLARAHRRCCLCPQPSEPILLRRGDWLLPPVSSGTDSSLCLQKECGLLRISTLNTCGSTSAFLEVWGIEEDGRDGFIWTWWPSCLQGNPENSACPSSVESTRGQWKVPLVFFQGSSWDPSHHVAYLYRDIFNSLLDLGNG